MQSTADELFLAELDRRGIVPQFNTETDRYAIAVGDLTIHVSLDNLRRDYALEQDSACVGHFVDVVLNAVGEDLPPWDEAKLSIVFYLEPSDYVEPPPIKKSVSEKLDQVPVFWNKATGGVRWISADELEGWNVSLEEVEAVAKANLSAALLSSTIECQEIDSVRLGYFETALPFKTALLLAPNLREVVSKSVGWPIYAVAPDSDFVYMWPAEHRDFVNRVGDVVLREFERAPHPLSTEVFLINDSGIRAIGSF